MEMEMGTDPLWFHLNPPLPPPSSGQKAFFYYPPFAVAVMTNKKRDVDPTPPPQPPPSRSRPATRKDRHSKICTAGGMREPRIRLSQDVARRFFALQDKLGFDKASKTVQWLLNMSTTGINHLTASMSKSMSLSEEDGSVLLTNKDHIVVALAPRKSNKQQQQQQQMPQVKRRTPAPRKKSNNGAPVLLPNKESRAKARQRARERTKDRNRLWSEAPAPARQLVVPVLPGASCNSYYDEEQEPWELGGVVFGKPHFH